MTDAQYTAWLEDSRALRCVLIEADVSVNGQEITRYMSSATYVSSSNDTPPSEPYLGIVAGGVSLTRKLSLDGNPVQTRGDIELNNEDGSRDSWLNDTWENREIRLYYGDATWPKSDFRRIFKGVTSGIGTRERGRLNLSLRDNLEWLNTAISETKLGGTTDNKDRLIPVCFGENFNVEPLLTNPVTLEYALHDGAIERIIEVRDGANPVAFTPNLAAGRFTLPQQPAYLVTVSVQGDKGGGVYRNTVAGIIRQIVTRYGTVSGRFTEADIDTANFDAFDVANPQPVGIWIPERMNMIQGCYALADSVGAKLIPGEDGRLQLIKIALPALGTPILLDEWQLMQKTLKVAGRPLVAAAVKLAYCKNWTVQTTLTAGIPEGHKNIFALEWYTATATNAAVAAKYKLTEEPVQVETLLLTEADAQAEAQRRLDLWAQQRTIHSFVSTPALMLLPLGAAVILKNYRYGLKDGKPGQVISISRDWTTWRTQVEVLV